jgi:uncharacterized glyoxalase superfamily protein PhnB
MDDRSDARRRRHGAEFRLGRRILRGCACRSATPMASMRVGRHNQEGIVATTQEALQVSAIVPSLTVDDLQKSTTFYEALGFAVEERWEEQGTLLGVMLRAGKTQLGLNQDDWKKGRDRKKGIGMRLFMSTTQNVDEIAKRAKSAGIALKSEPHDTEWKTRAFEVIDPSGFMWTIGSETPA